MNKLLNTGYNNSDLSDNISGIVKSILNNKKNEIEVEQDLTADSL